jgi:hypothetical protein
LRFESRPDYAPFLLSAALRGPFGTQSGWQSPWRSRGRTTEANAQLEYRRQRRALRSGSIQAPERPLQTAVNGSTAVDAAPELAPHHTPCIESIKLDTKQEQPPQQAPSDHVYKPRRKRGRKRKHKQGILPAVDMESQMSEMSEMSHATDAPLPTQNQYEIPESNEICRTTSIHAPTEASGQIKAHASGKIHDMAEVSESPIEPIPRPQRDQYWSRSQNVPASSAQSAARTQSQWVANLKESEPLRKFKRRWAQDGASITTPTPVTSGPGHRNAYRPLTPVHDVFSLAETGSSFAWTPSMVSRRTSEPVDQSDGVASSLLSDASTVTPHSYTMHREHQT